MVLWIFPREEETKEQYLMTSYVEWEVSLEREQYVMSVWKRASAVEAVGKKSISQEMAVAEDMRVAVAGWVQGSAA
jgi:hypothetical protein